MNFKQNKITDIENNENSKPRNEQKICKIFGTYIKARREDVFKMLTGNFEDLKTTTIQSAKFNTGSFKQIGSSFTINYTEGTTLKARILDYNLKKFRFSYLITEIKGKDSSLVGTTCTYKLYMITDEAACYINLKSEYPRKISGEGIQFDINRIENFHSALKDKFPEKIIN